MASQTTGGKPEPIRSTQKLGQRLRTSLRAAATRLKGESVRTVGRSMRQDWQQDAWDLFDLVGEQHFLGTTLANRIGQARLYVGRLSDDPTEPPEPVEDGPAVEVFDAFGGSQGGRAQLIARLGINLFVAGDGWLIGIPRHLLPDTDEASIDTDPGTGITPVELLALSDLEWRMLSVSEVGFDQNRVTLKFGASQDEQAIVYAEDIFLIRVWRPHPRRWWEADSPTRATLPVLRELVGLTEHVSAQVDSRLAGAGVYIVPQSAVDAILARAGTPEDDESDQDPFTEALMDAMITPIKDRSNASAFVPLVTVVPDESAEKFRHISFASQLDAESRNLREEAIRRLALGQDAPPEVLLGMGDSSHWACVDTETEIFTRRGWLTHDQLTTADEVLTLNHDNGNGEWQLIEQIHSYQVADAPMRHIETGNHSSLTTLNHRWATVQAQTGTRRWRTSETLNAYDAIPICAPVEGLPANPKYSDAMVELAAWYATDAYNGQGTVALMQSHSRNPERVASIRKALTDEFGSDGFTEAIQHSDGSFGGPITCFRLRSQAADELTGIVGDRRVTKHEPKSERLVSLDFVNHLTLAQLHLFIDTYCEADGWHWRRGIRDVWLVNPRQLDAFEHAAVLAGYATSRTRSGDGWCVRLLNGSPIRPIKATEQTARTGVGSASDEVITYTGAVWCPQVPNRTWLARRNGRTFFTGNSWLVREDTVTTHVEPPLALMCDALTTQFLRPVLIQQGMDPEQAAEYVIWYDVSHLIQRPNRVQDAQQAHAAGVISDDAYRDVLGFSDADAPQVADEDPAITLAFELIKGAPSLAQQPGIPALVEQIRQVMSGETTPAEVPAADEDAPADDGEGAPTPPSQTINDVNLPEDGDASPLAVAASGYQLYVDSPDLTIKARPKAATIGVDHGEG